jgi:hypothetical protein
MDSKITNSKVKVTAEDGHQFDAYVAESSSPARGSIVLIQEISASTATYGPLRMAMPKMAST